MTTQPALQLGEDSNQQSHEEFSPYVRPTSDLDSQERKRHLDGH
jgi:hypothetical protein